MSGLRQRLFGPGRREMWRQLSEQLGADFIDGGAWKGDKVVATHKQWTITLDKHVVSTGKVTVVYTRMRAPYVNPDGFRFTIYRRGFFSGIATRLGMQDVEVGYRQFDEDYVIKGTNEHQLRALFANERIQDLLATQPTIRLTVKDDEGWFGPEFPDGVDELHALRLGVVTNTEELKQLFELFTVTLDELCRIGSAYDYVPEVKL